MKSCKKCVNEHVKSNEIGIEDLNQWLAPVLRDRQIATNKNNMRYELFKCQACGTYWEWRPLYEESMYGGEPGEWSKVSSKHVEDNY